ncbi:hypothetical protein GCM10012275_08490 [Longimycelium tulufanense]|uniref:AAA domain-containing protein n=1 Tax=Longimycelium tulufanense TaxID=907463 RepID=A0A8J3CCM2_9PSEU|nr:AAA family ATPase [Longimycelium tulufanense]GGM39881.1 hypothetical protein GCM10012275_08490 [Longimycelium tulufanense]
MRPAVPLPTPQTTPTLLTVLLGRRDLLVVAGLPGAGKSTLLRLLHSGAEITVLDSEHVCAVLRGWLPPRLPYRWYRPLVHVLHRLRITAHAIAGPGPLVVHEPATRVTTRLAFVLLGALTRRPRRLLWIDATPDEALAGQRTRGRLIRPRSFRRHVRRAGRVRALLRAGRTPFGWTSATMLHRSHTTGGLSLAVTPT